MINLTNTNTNGAALTSYAIGRTTLLGNRVSTILWSPTFRQAYPDVVGNATQLTSPNPYYVGLKENLRIDTNSGRPWRHRRICFTTKGEELLQQPVPNTGGVPWAPFVDDPANGYARPYFDLSVSGNFNNTVSVINNVVFRGTFNADWDNRMDAAVDTDRVKLWFDKTWVIRPGTTVGSSVSRKLWHPMKKTLFYDQDEEGKIENVQKYSTLATKGMGDYYVLDIFDCFAGQATDALSIGGDSVLYWHEK